MHPGFLLHLVEPFLTIHERIALHTTCKELNRKIYADTSLKSLELYGDKAWPFMELSPCGRYCYFPESNNWSKSFKWLYIQMLCVTANPWKRRHFQTVAGFIMGAEQISRRIDLECSCSIDFKQKHGRPGIKVSVTTSTGWKQTARVLPHEMEALGVLLGGLKSIEEMCFQFDVRSMKYDVTECPIYQFYENCLIRAQEFQCNLYCVWAAPKQHWIDRFYWTASFEDQNYFNSRENFNYHLDLLLLHGVIPRKDPFPWPRDRLWCTLSSYR